MLWDARDNLPPARTPKVVAGAAQRASAQDARSTPSSSSSSSSSAKRRRSVDDNSYEDSESGQSKNKKPRSSQDVMPPPQPSRARPLPPLVLAIRTPPGSVSIEEESHGEIDAALRQPAAPLVQGQRSLEEELQQAVLAAGPLQSTCLEPSRKLTAFQELFNALALPHGVRQHHDAQFRDLHSILSTLAQGTALPTAQSLFSQDLALLLSFEHLVVAAVRSTSLALRVSAMLDSNNALRSFAKELQGLKQPISFQLHEAFKALQTNAPNLGQIWNQISKIEKTLQELKTGLERSNTVITLLDTALTNETLTLLAFAVRNRLELVRLIDIFSSIKDSAPTLVARPWLAKLAADGVYELESLLGPSPFPVGQWRGGHFHCLQCGLAIAPQQTLPHFHNPVDSLFATSNAFLALSECNWICAECSLLHAQQQQPQQPQQQPPVKTSWLDVFNLSEVQVDPYAYFFECYGPLLSQHDRT